MFCKILAAVDNSSHSDRGVEAALKIARAFGSEVTGCHVYAAALHESRFMDMEAGLPQEYQSEAALARQRDIHGSLITKGMATISGAYLDRFEAAAREAGISGFKRKSREGKNYVELIAESIEGRYDLVVMGALGVGAVESSQLGGVAERTARHIDSNLLVVKTPSFDKDTLVGIDGSASSFAALEAAIGIKKTFGGDIEAIAVFDPFFHQAAFKNISGALSEEALKVFKFNEQEKLHDEIIDKGLAKLYQGHLDRAYKIALSAGVEIKTTLAAGKPFDAILKAASKGKTSFIVAGRYGLHRDVLSRMGNTAENLLRLSSVNVFIAGGEFKADEKTAQAGPGLNWTPEALSRLERIPPFARGMAKKAIEDFAASAGYNEITGSVMDEAKKRYGI